MRFATIIFILYLTAIASPFVMTPPDKNQTKGKIYTDDVNTTKNLAKANTKETA